MSLKEYLKLYIPLKPPRYLEEKYKIQMKMAGITSPKKFLRDLSLATYAFTICLSILAYFLGFVRFNISTSTVTNPIPYELRPILYAIISYLLLPLNYIFLLKSYLVLKITSRREDIDLNLHNLYIALLGFAKARIPLKDMIKDIAELGIGEISKEFTRIYNLHKYGNKTLSASIIEVAGTTPSRKLSDLLRGIVSVVEAGGDLSRFIEERLQNLDVEKKILYTEFLRRLELVAEMYITVTIAIPTVVISLQLARCMSGEVDLTQAYAVIYGVIPLATLGMIIMLLSFSPEKGVFRRGLHYLAVVPAFSVLGILLGFFLGNVEFWFLLFTIVGSIISYLLLRSILTVEDQVAQQVLLYFNRVLALVEAGKDLTTAFSISAKETEPPLGKYMKTFSMMLQHGISRTKAFDWLCEVAPHPDLKTVSKILKRTADVGGNITSVLLSVVNELTRLNGFRQERESCAKSFNGLTLFTVGMFLGICIMLATMLLPTFAKALMKSSTTTIGSSMPRVFSGAKFTVLRKIRTLLRHAVYIVAMSSAVGMSAVRVDFRRLPLPLAIMTTVALIVSILFLNLRVF